MCKQPHNMKWSTVSFSTSRCSIYLRGGGAMHSTASSCVAQHSCILGLRAFLNISDAIPRYIIICKPSATNRPAALLIAESASESTQSVSPSVIQSVRQSVSQSVSQSASQPGWQAVSVRLLSYPASTLMTVEKPDSLASCIAG